MSYTEVPYKIRRAANQLGEWVRTNGAKENASIVVAYMCAIEDAPYMSSPDPLVVLEYEFDGRYGGHFKKKDAMHLSECVVMHMCNPTFCFSGDLGKHSEVEATLDEFTIRWYLGEGDVEQEACHTIHYWEEEMDLPNGLDTEDLDKLVALACDWIAQQNDGCSYDISRVGVPAMEGFRPTYESFVADSTKRRKVDKK